MWPRTVIGSLCVTRHARMEASLIETKQSCRAWNEVENLHLVYFLIKWIDCIWINKKTCYSEIQILWKKTRKRWIIIARQCKESYSTVSWGLLELYRKYKWSTEFTSALWVLVCVYHIIIYVVCFYSKGGYYCYLCYSAQYLGRLHRFNENSLCLFSLNQSKVM